MDKMLLLYIVVATGAYLAIGAVFALFLERYNWLYGFACGDENWATEEIIIGWPILLFSTIAMVIAFIIAGIVAAILFAIYAIVIASGKVVGILKPHRI